MLLVKSKLAQSGVHGLGVFAAGEEIVINYRDIEKVSFLDCQ